MKIIASFRQSNGPKNQYDIELVEIEGVFCVRSKHVAEDRFESLDKAREQFDAMVALLGVSSPPVEGQKQ